MNAPHSPALHTALTNSTPTTGGWPASLNLGYRSRDQRTFASRREHFGPLRILKGFPSREGEPDLFEQIIVHPPGGIAFADQLQIRIDAGANTHVLITSPGAAKWYKGRSQTIDTLAGSSPLVTAQQDLHVTVGPHASFEWLPLENIVFNSAMARLSGEFVLDDGASLICADVFALGRPIGGELFDRGYLGATTTIRRKDRLIFNERLVLRGGDRILNSRAGLAGASCFGTLIAVPGHADSPDQNDQGAMAGLTDLRDCIRDAYDTAGLPGSLGVTAMPECLIARWYGNSTEQAWESLRTAWRVIRQSVTGRNPVSPRIWSC